MAYQPKSYKKFVATAATATLVASAIAPVAFADSSKFTDVSAKYKDAVDFVVSKGANGLTATTFGVDANIKRVDAAVLLVNVLGLDIEAAPASGLVDVPQRAVKHINALKAAGITSGKTPTTFDPDAQITRGELAIWIAKAFKLNGTSTTDFKDVSASYAPYVSALVAAGVTSGTSETTFGTTANAKRGDYAIFLQRAAGEGTTPVPGELAVTSVTNLDDANRFLEIAFNKAVSNLDASDITIQDADTEERYGVKEVKLSADRKIATVELYAKEDADEVLRDNQTYNLTVNANGSVLKTTFEFPEFVKGVVTDIDFDERTIEVAGNVVDVPEDTEFDFYDALGREARVWFNDKNDLVKYAFNQDETVVEGAFKVTKKQVTNNDDETTAGEIEVLTTGKKYKFATDFNGFKNGTSTSFDTADVEYDFAKIVLNENGRVQTLASYEPKGQLLVSKVDGDYIFGYDDDSVELDKFVIVKEGKQIAISDIQKDDLVFYNEDAEEDGVAIVSSTKITGEIENVFSDSFEIDGKIYDYDEAQYLTSKNEIETFDDDAAEKLQAGGEVTVYLNYKGEVAFVKGAEGAVTDQYVAGVLTDTLLGYSDSKGEGNIEVEYETKDGVKLYDFKVGSLDEVVIQTNGEEVTFEVGDDLDTNDLKAANRKTPANGDWEIDEFRLIKNVTTATADFALVAVNEAGQELGTLIENYKQKSLAIYADGNVVKGIKFYDDSVVIGKYNSKIESKDRYVSGKQLTDDTLVFDIDAEYGTAYDDRDVTVTTWGELKSRGVDIAAGTADVYSNEDDVVTHLVVFDGIDAADTEDQTALLTRIDKNTKNEIVRVQALVGGELKTFTADKLSGSRDLEGVTVSSLIEGSVVELEVNGDEVTKIKAANNITGTVKQVKVGTREVVITLPNGEEKTVELASDGEVYEATDRDGDDFTVENLREISVGDKVVVALADATSRFAEAIVIASNTVVDANGGMAPVIVSAKYTNTDNDNVTTGDIIEVTFSESVSLVSGQTLEDDFAFGAGIIVGTGVSYAVSGNTVKITLGTGAAYTAGATATVNVTSTAGNVSLVDSTGLKAIPTRTAVEVK